MLCAAKLATTVSICALSTTGARYPKKNTGVTDSIESSNRRKLARNGEKHHESHHGYSDGADRGCYVSRLRGVGEVLDLLLDGVVSMSACEYIFRFNMNTSTTTEVDGVTTVRMGTELHERIVRCRDCKHADKVMTRYAGLQYACMKFDDATVEPDGFCAWGERKADA